MSTPQEKAEEVRKEIDLLLNTAKYDEVWKSETKADPSKLQYVTNPSIAIGKDKTQIGFRTYSFIDGVFLDDTGVPLVGVPFGANCILTGLPNSGKTLLMMQIAMKVAESGIPVAYVLSEKIFRANSARFDIESQMRGIAGALQIDWTKVSNNLYVIDTVQHSDLRDWTNFVSTYRTLVESKKIELVLIDSMTLLEDSRGALKYRVLELMRYNQTHGLTSIMINQRAIEEADTLAMAGGVALSYAVDIVMALDYKKVSSWDSALKLDTNAKQGEVANFFRILKCSLSKFDGKYYLYEITPQGQVKPKPKVVEEERQKLKLPSER